MESKKEALANIDHIRVDLEMLRENTDYSDAIVSCALDWLLEIENYVKGLTE